MNRALALIGACVLVATVSGCRPGDGERPTADAALPPEWQWEHRGPGGAGMPAADASGVSLTVARSRAVLLDATGRVVWEVEEPGARDVAPALTPELVLVPTDEGLTAFDRSTGRPRWRRALGERANTPVVAHGRAVVTTWEGSLLAFDLGDGAISWRARLPGGALGPAAAAGDMVAATWEADDASGAGMVAVAASDGALRWDSPLPGGGVSAPALVASGPQPFIAVAVAGDLAVHALAAGSGEPRWRADAHGAGSPEVPPLPVGDDAVVVADRQGGLVLLDAAGGTPRWNASTDGAAVRGGPAGPGPGGSFALPLDDGRVVVAGPAGATRVLDPPGLVSGVAAGPGGTLLVATAAAGPATVTAATGW